MAAKLTTIWWRDIPAQVTAKSGHSTERMELSPRFQAAIDRAAMNAGLFGTDEYLAAWRRETCACSDDLLAEVAEAAAQLETTFTSEILLMLAENGGTTLLKEPEDS